MRADGTIVVTGASGAIGGALAANLVQSGHLRVACQYRTRPDGLVAMLAAAGCAPERHAFRADLTNDGEVRELAAAVEETLGPIAAIVNAAGATSNGMSWKLASAEFRRIVDANLTSAFLMSQSVIPGMRERGSGRIVNVSSIAGVQGAVGAAHYCASKAGLIGLTRAMSLELARFKITVNAVALGYFDDGMIHSIPEEIQGRIKERIPLGRFGHVAEAVAAIRYLLDDGAAYVTGQVLNVNGGMC